MNEAISAFLRERIDANDFPSAVYLVAEKGEIVFQDALGNAVVEPERIKAKLDTIYDLASLTKPLATGLLAAMLIENGQLGLTTRIRDLGDEFSAANENLEIRHLTAHNSGLSAWYPFYPLYVLPNKEAAVLRLILEMTNEEIAVPDRNVRYSDLNFILLGFCLLSAYKKTIETPYRKLFEDLVARPLKLIDTQFNPADGLKFRIAANERGNVYERQMAIDEGYMRKLEASDKREDGLRNGIIWGDVHDGNAYLLGGSAGHAGLFSTAEEVYKIALQFLPSHTQLLKPETCSLFRTELASGSYDTAGIVTDFHRSFAFELASTTFSTAGTTMSPESFGHNGFTGTSLWIDPVKDRIFILLTNRTHNHPLPFVNINSVRRGFHDLAIEALDAR